MATGPTPQAGRLHGGLCFVSKHPPHIRRRPHLRAGENCSVRRGCRSCRPFHGRAFGCTFASRRCSTRGPARRPDRHPQSRNRARRTRSPTTVVPVGLRTEPGRAQRARPVCANMPQGWRNRRHLRPDRGSTWRGRTMVRFRFGQHGTARDIAQTYRSRIRSCPCRCVSRH